MIDLIRSIVVGFICFIIGCIHSDGKKKTGTWEHKNVSSEGVDEWQAAQCSVCGLWHTTPYLYYYEHYKFCPNCGARMDGDADADKSIPD